ncbi:MAG: FecR domain-containing protein [Acidobacteria bacterium]|nr:FecR domain-containing protein [Acidobacteriota bacterium]
MTKPRATKPTTATQARSVDRTMAAVHLNSRLNSWRNPWVPMLVSLLVLALAALVAFPLGATTTELGTDAYGFVSRVEGGAMLSGLEDDDAIEAEVNHPLLTGDLITTDSGRVELVLPDGTVVRMGPGTSVIFDALAGAPDSEIDDGTLILLDRGELQIRTPETFLGGRDLAVQTSNATVYLGASGSYRITAQGSSFTEVVVREGFAEAETGSGSSIARTGEALEINGTTRPFVDVVAAGPADSLELWAGDLDRAADAAMAAAPAYVDSRLAYAAAPLHDAGEWVYVDSRRAWSPYVRADWRPFRHGRWVYTPSGLTWVASARWGWVTSHYGFWDFVPGYGWLWLPGNVYFPAGVYWYWGPTHVAWIPYGYYNRYARSGFRFGVYGWAGGDWGYWSDWTFCPTRYFGRRGYDRYWDTGSNLGRERRFAVPRGIVTTDTRGLGPERWGKPSEALDTLLRRVDPEGRVRSLPDVTEFVARREVAKPSIWSQEPRLVERRLSVRERLQPLPEERKRGRFGTPSLAASRAIDSSESTRLIGSSGSGGSGGLRRLDRSVGPSVGSSVGPSVGPSGEWPRSGTKVRFGSGVRSGSAGSPGSNTAGIERSSQRFRSVAGRRLEPGSRSVADRPSARDGASSRRLSVRDALTGSQSAPARRVLDRIRAHRESARGASSETKGSSSRQLGTRSRSVSKGSSSSSSRAPARRSSSSSTKSSSSTRGSSPKASPPSRSSSNRSSASRSKSSSRSRSKPRSKN